MSGINPRKVLMRGPTVGLLNKAMFTEGMLARWRSLGASSVSTSTHSSTPSRIINISSRKGKPQQRSNSSFSSAGEAVGWPSDPKYMAKEKVSNRLWSLEYLWSIWLSMARYASVLVFD